MDDLAGVMRSAGEESSDHCPSSEIDWDAIATAVRSWLLSEDRVLPCDVTVHPATTFKAGVKLSTLLDCIEDRRAAIGQPEAEFSGWVEIVEEGK